MACKYDDPAAALRWAERNGRVVVQLAFDFEPPVGPGGIDVPRVTCTEIQFLGGGQGQGQVDAQEPVVAGVGQEVEDLPF